jgi:hypothetical protein
MQRGGIAGLARPRAAPHRRRPSLQNPAALTTLAGLPDADRGLAKKMMIIIPFSGREPVFARTLRRAGFTGD